MRWPRVAKSESTTVFSWRHALSCLSILDNGNPAYDQYKNADGTPRYVQRSVQTAYLANIRASGGRRQTGKLEVKTIVIEDLVDPNSYPYVAAFYAAQVKRTMGSAGTDKVFRVYYNDSSGHGAAGPIAAGKPSTTTIDIDGILTRRCSTSQPG